MKMANNIFRFTILALICSCVFFLSKNYALIKDLNEKNGVLQLQENNLKKNLKKTSGISYSDVLQKLNGIEGVQILNFSRSSEGKITVNVEITGDKTKVVDAFKKISQKENFYSMDNITMEQDRYENLKARTDINFVP
ncbi:hypothetical protein ACFHWD_05665 [Clostridium sp. MT-14]|uniref:Uncharacterized protein n=1 Tax=Clostridium aromativorans TaxID=2836848 RepID=A0ABS8N2N1_9CLOT|nr:MULTISPECIES: hypothetical protein [Clostridium]KAA8674893.1 hypothetical protein F3O63_06230 [Clostridium sp. HV4-5-A1G]MCC9294043.1 hypothetical protein [Clostridium aromativorans]CAB1242907.1 conserved hypothetical protein [Clostridiaceae bacterium BL-3]